MIVRLQRFHTFVSSSLIQLSLEFPPELDLGRSAGELAGVSIETSCHGRSDARRIIVKREVVGAGISKSSSREVYVDVRCMGTVILRAFNSM